MNKYLLLLYVSNALSVSLTTQEARTIGQKIWKNECAGTIDGLTSWNKGEEFASLGIGHFIWIPTHQKNRVSFKESFPSLLAFMKNKGKKLPIWLTPHTPCPWKNRAAFLAQYNSPRMKELRTFLTNTIHLQTLFIMQRLEKTLPKILDAVSHEKKQHIHHQFHRMSCHPQGAYILADYINFKGEGISTKERYQGKGWGLLQVLERMHGSHIKTADAEFVSAAKEILNQRVTHAPAHRNESRWIPGWYNRLDTYITQ